MRTYDIYFHDNENSNNCGFDFSYDMAKAYIEMYNGSNKGYFEDYKGGVVQIYCNETEEVVYEEPIF
jgi:hypothetical protein